MLGCRTASRQSTHEKNKVLLLQQEQLESLLLRFTVVTLVLRRADTIHWVSTATYTDFENEIAAFTNTSTEQVYQPTFSQLPPSYA